MNKILIIDDTKENLEAVKDSLELLIPDCVVITTGSGKEGLKAAKDVQPDVIISDVFMPEMDGIEVCKRLKADETTKHIPIIIHTGSTTNAESRIQCLEAGADVFLAKPIDAGELTAQINAMLRIKKAEDKLRAEKEQLDVAVHKRTKELKESEEALTLVIENIPFAVFAHNLDGEFILVNKTSTEFTGYTKKELLKMRVSDLDHKSITRDDRKNIWENLQYGGHQQVFSSHYRKDGSQYPIEVHITAISLRNEPVIIGIVQDITERKQVEEKLKKSEQNLLSLFRAMSDIVLELDREGRYINIAPTSPDLLYKPSSEILGKTLHDIFPLKEADKFLSMIHKSLDEYRMVKIEYPLKIKNKIIWFEGKATPKTKDTVLYIARDITERKQAETIQETLYNISYALNATDNIQDLYIKIKEFLGAVLDTTNFYIALYNKKTDMISLPFNVDEKDDFKTFPAGKTITKYVIKTGKSLFATKDVVKKLIKKGLIETIGSPSEIWLGVPLKIDNKVIGVIVVQSYDDPNLYTEKDIEILNFISEEIALAIDRKQAEEELKVNRERLKIANSILRHDIANDLIVIKSALDIYHEEQDKTMLDEIDKRVDKSLDTIQKQRDQEQFLHSHADLDEYVIENIARDVVKNYPDFKINVTGKGRAFADNAIYSVFENIISNAIKHSKTAKLDIAISSEEDHCLIKFVDYGVGISDEIKNRIFNEGFHYGKTGHTGIGLYIVQKTIDEYGGEVFVEDNKPKGTVFVVRLRKIIER